MKRPFQKHHIAERSHLSRRDGISLQTPAAFSQQHEGKVRPGGLRIDPTRESFDICIPDGVIGQHRDTGAGGNFFCQPADRCIYGSQAAFTQDTGCDRRIAPLRRKNNRAFGNRIEHGGH